MALPLLESVAKNWWVLLIRGILAVLFGIMAYLSPGLTLLTLIFLFGIYALSDGIGALYVGGVTRSIGLILIGVLGVIVGIYAFVSPGFTALALQTLIAVWAIVRGIFEIVNAIKIRNEITNEWWLILAGIFSILLGVILFANPAAGAIGMIWAIGAYALIYGVMLIVAAFRLKSLPARLENRVEARFGH